MAFTRPTAAQLNLDTVNMTDPLVRLNSGETGSADKDSGIVIERGNDTNVAVIYDESADKFALINTTETGTTSGNVTIASYASLQVATLQTTSQSVGGHIIPTDDNTYDLGSTSYRWRDVYVGPGSLYVNNKQVISDDSGTITVQTTVDQSLTVKTTGTGVTTVQSVAGVALTATSSGDITLTTSSGNIELKGTVEVLTGKQVVDSAGTKVEFGSQIDMNSNRIIDVADPSSAQDAATKAYVDSETSGIVTTQAIAGDSGTDNLTLGSDTLTFTGTANEVTTAVTNNVVTFSLPDDVTIGGNLVVTGNHTVNGTTTTVATTNMVVSDSLIELNNGASSNANDLGIVMERGSTGDNAIIAWDESADKFIVGTTTATGATTGNLSITTGTLVANIEGDVTGNITGSSGSATGNAATATLAADATKLATTRAIQVSGAVTGTANFDGSAAINIVTTATSDPTITLGGDLSGSATLTNLGNATLTATVGTLNQNTTGSAATLTTTRAIQVSGAVTGTANFDGSAAINIVTTNTADPTITLGGDLSGNVTLTNLASGTLTATVGTLNQNTTGSAATLTTTRAIQVSGAVTGTANFDGSAAINIVTTNTADPTITLGGDLSGSATLTNLGNATLTATVGTLNQNTTGTAATVTTAAQTAITSLGTLTALQVDNININGNTISSTAGTDLLITPLAGQQIVLDGAIVIDAGVVTGATSITSTAFVGALTGNVTGNTSGSSGSTTGNAATATALATTRAIQVSGAVTGTANFDGSAAINIVTTNTADPTITLGGELSGSATLTNLGNATLTATVGTLNGLAIASTQTITMGSNRVTNVADPVGSQDAVTKAWAEANLSSEGGGSSGFTNSTFTTAPGSDGNFDLAKRQNQTGSVETPFESGGADAFGVNLGEIYDQMEPVGSTSAVDLGVLS
jgi:hypothetical protein